MIHLLRWAGIAIGFWAIYVITGPDPCPFHRHSKTRQTQTL